MKLSSLLLFSFLILCLFAIAHPKAHADAISIDVSANKSVVLYADGNLIYHAPCTPRAPVKSRSECDLTKAQLLFDLNDAAPYFLRGLNHFISKPVALSPLTLGEVTILLKGESPTGKADLVLYDELKKEQSRLQGLLQSYGEDKVTRATLVNTNSQIAQVKIRLGTDANYTQSLNDFKNLIKEFIVPHVTQSTEWESILASRNVGTLAGAFQQIMMKNDVENDMDFITVQPGTFLMGDADANSNAIRHLVTISHPFDLQKTPVTQMQWHEVMGDDTRHSRFIVPSACTTTHIDLTSASGNTISMCPQNPIDAVDFNSITNAGGFLDKINQQDGRYSYRLPTEAEYEYALRGGAVNSKTNLLYYIGNDPGNFEQYEWLRTNSGGTTHEVATLKPNPLGFYDLLGNVQEWTQDRWGNFNNLAVTDPKGSIDDTREHVIRGAGIDGYSEYLRSGYRRDQGDDNGYNTGFRLVRVLK